MARVAYQYETSPRKVEPKYRNNSKKKLEVIENKQSNNRQLDKKAKIKRKNQIFLVIAIFATLLAISYRNSIINEEFKKIQNQENQLAIIQKENKQLEVSLESSLNLNNIEKIATEQLGMKKQTSNQTIYTELEKEDYIEATSLNENQQNNTGIFSKIIDFFKGNN